MTDLMKMLFLKKCKGIEVSIPDAVIRLPKFLRRAASVKSGGVNSPANCHLFDLQLKTELQR